MRKSFAWLGLLTVAFLIVALACSKSHRLYAGVASLMLLPLMGVTTPLGEGEFQEKVLGGVKALETKADTLVKDFGRLDKETKTAFEEITKLQKTANESDSDRKKFIAKMAQIEALLRNQVKGAWGDPAARISANDEMRERLNLAVRLACDKKGDMLNIIGPRLKALGEDTSPGSTLINTALAKEMYDTLAMYGAWNTFAIRRLGTKVTKFPVKTARAIAYWLTSEAATIPDDTNKTGTTVTLTVEVIAALINVSLQLIQDAEFDVTADVVDDFGEAAAFRLDQTVFNSDGTNNNVYGGFTGIIHGGTASVAASGHTTVETMTDTDFRNVILSVDPVVLQRAARWWIHPQMLVRTLGIKDGNGRSIFLNALEAPSVGGIGSILGYPITMAQAMPNTNSASNTVAAFGDPNGGVVGLRQDFGIESSDEFRWNTFERSFRGVGRATFGVRRSQAFGISSTAAS